MSLREKLKRINIDAEKQRMPNVNLIKKTFTSNNVMSANCPDCTVELRMLNYNDDLSEYQCPKCNTIFWYIKSKKEWKVVKEVLTPSRRYVPEPKPIDRNVRRRMK